jgi:DNA polymerase III delta prime subunit
LQSTELSRDRAQLMSIVERQWIQGVLQQSMAHRIRLDLQIVDGSNAQIVPGLTSRPGSDQIVQVYDDAAGPLAIIGPPGAGKTTLLLELAQELLGRAEHDVDYPVPVIFNLASWDSSHRFFADWLIKELREHYGIHAERTQSWIDDDLIVPLLDGFDEVTPEHRHSCKTAIDGFLAQRPTSPAVISCRESDYATAKPVVIAGAVYIQPLTRPQVERYLKLNGLRWQELATIIEANASVREWLTTPLLLSILTRTFVADSAVLNSIQQSPETASLTLLSSYVQVTLSDPRSRRELYPRNMTLRWLSWLARSMKMHGQTVFYLESLQPSWLFAGAGRGILTYGVSLFLGGCIGLLAGLLASLVTQPPVGLAIGVAVGLIGGLVGYQKEIRPVTKLQWSATLMKDELRSGILAGLFGALFGTLQGGWKAGLVLGPAMGLVPALTVAAIRGITGDKALGQSLQPNEGMRKSGRNALIGGLACATLAGVVGGITVGVSAGAWTGIVVGLIGGLIVGSLVAILIGGRALLQHMVLRLLLAVRGVTPWSFSRFLDYATDRVLLIRVGGGFMFPHNALMEYFASLLDSERTIRY